MATPIRRTPFERRASEPVMRTVRRFVAPLIGVGLFVGAFAMQSTVPPALRKHVETLSTAEGLTVKFTYQPLSGAPADYTLQFARPNLMRVEGGGQLLVTNGKTLFRYNKLKNTYTSEEAGRKFYDLLTDYRLWVWAGFFEKNAAFRGYKAARPGNSRTMHGADVQEVALDFENGSTATVYVDKDSGMARGGSASMSTGGYMVFASSVKTGPVPASVFNFTPPPGAKRGETSDFVNGQVRFVSVLGIFQRSCSPCHMGAMASGGVSLGTYVGARRVVVPGNPGASLLMRMVSGARPRMPKGGPALSQTQVALISAWIKGGAKN